MVKRKIKVIAFFFILGIFIIMSPTMLIAGGKFQEKIQQKINAPKNVQYNLDVGQSESTLDEEIQVNGDKQERKDKKSSPTSGAQREKDLLRRMHSEERPVFSSYAVYKTDYKAEIEEDVVTIKGNTLFEVFKKGWTQIPLVSSNVGLIDVSINRGASFVTLQGGKYYLIIDKPGKYNLDIEFLIKATRERKNGPGSFNFEVLPAPISQFEFTIPESEVEIFVEPSIKLELTRQPKRTIAWAVMPNTNNITVRWIKALPKEEITPVKLEAKVYLDTATYASIGEGLIRCRSSLNYSILQSEISNLRIALPEDLSVLDVQARDLRDWKISNKEGQQYLDVYLNFGVKGNYTLSLTYERKIGEGSVVAEIPWVRGVGVEREKGFFGLAAATNVELVVNKIEHATLIDVKELPSSIWSVTTHPILLAFKYLSHPFSIAIEVTRHEELPVLVAAIDSADYITLQTDGGKSLTKAIYQIRNNVKQFIHLVLPKNATLWSVFVAGKPVKPAKDKNGDILIPLEKSLLSGETLTQFPVEVVYLDKNSKMGLWDNLKLNLPQTDIPISNLIWSVYLPVDYVYFNFRGDVKRLRKGRHIFPQVSKVVQMEGKEISKVKYDRLAVQQQYAPPAQQLYEEVQQAQMRGVLPIKIDIPRQGYLYRFSKLLVTEKESPWLSLNYITVFEQAQGLFGFLIFVIILISIVLFRKKLFKLILKK